MHDCMMLCKKEKEPCDKHAVGSDSTCLILCAYRLSCATGSAENHHRCRMAGNPPQVCRSRHVVPPVLCASIVVRDTVGRVLR
jgi:hypothetical protein